MFTAPTTRSSIIFKFTGSPPLTTVGSIAIETMSPLPLATQRTSPPPVSPCDGLAGQVVAHARDLGLDPLRGFDEPFEVGDRHQVLISLSETLNTFCAFLIMGCWRASASRFLRSDGLRLFLDGDLGADGGRRRRPARRRAR